MGDLRKTPPRQDLEPRLWYPRPVNAPAALLRRENRVSESEIFQADLAVSRRTVICRSGGLF
jgi:hypothetical protein